MPLHNEFEPRLHHNYASSISAGLSDTRSFGSNSGAVRPIQQQFRLPEPIGVGFRSYPQPSAPTWDGTLPNYYPDTSLLRSNHDHNEGPVRSGTENPLLNWYTNTDGPWVPRGMVPEVPLDHSQSRGQPLGFRSTGSTTPIEPHHPRETNSSEYGSVPFVHLPSDSGYGTRRSFENASVFSSELLDRSQECSSLTSQGNDSQSFPTLKVPDRPVEPDNSESWAGSQPASNTNHSRSEALRCPECGKDVKTKSELKKHDLRHKKPFHCQHPGCNYKKGFSTTNDLDRHTKSKHPSDSRRASSKLYRCAFNQCKSQSKEWPRLDNFRCHIKRVHQLEGDQLEELVRFSEYHVPLDNTENHGRQRASDRMDQTEPRDFRYQERDTQREFLQDLAILDKVPQEQHRSEENAVLMPFDASRPRVLPEAVLVSFDASRPRVLPDVPPNNMEFRSKVFGPSVPQLPGHSLRNDRLDNSSDPTHLGLNNQNASVKQRHSPESDSEQRDCQNVPRLASELQQDKVHSRIEPTCSGVAESLQSIRGLLEQQLETSRNTAALLQVHPEIARSAEFNARFPSNRTLPLPKQDLLTMSSQNVEQMKEVIKMIESLGRKFQEDSPSEETSRPHARKYPTPEPEPPIALNPGVKSESSHCPICMKVQTLPCRMKKHMKRHLKPYGCTFPRCEKVFGSKNDWKRHENSQHFQSETWRCDQDKPTSFITSCSRNPPCSKVFYRKESFKEHLVKEHRLSDLSIVKEKLETCRIGRNCSSRFWCGFCKELKELKKRGVEAWTERFNHIDDHFEGRKGLRKQSIKEWLPIDGGESPELQEERSSPEVIDVDDDESDSVSVVEDVERSQPASRNVAFGPDEWNPLATRKRPNDAGESGRPVKSARRSRPEERIICCQCDNAHNPAVVVGCNFCDDHRFCANCSYVEADPCPRGSDA